MVRALADSNICLCPILERYRISERVREIQRMDRELLAAIKDMSLVSNIIKRIEYTVEIR